MPLTRHLYELDEVTSALQTCLRDAHDDNGHFWLWELVQSAEHDVAYDSLIDTWLRWGGGYDPALLREPRPTTNGEWRRLFFRIRTAVSAAKATAKITEHYVNLTAAMPSRPTMTPLPASPAVAARRVAGASAFQAAAAADEGLNPADAARFWISLDSACRQHSHTDAMWLLQAVQPLLCADTVWAALKGSAALRDDPRLVTAVDTVAAAATAITTTIKDPTQQLLYQATAVMILCMPPAIRVTALADHDPIMADSWQFERDWLRWDTHRGRRAARVHAIPTKALHADTTRGRIPARYTNVGDVREPVPLLNDGCRWWRAAINRAGIQYDEETVAFPSDDVLELFYAEHFPDDIPDEWSAADQQKSHGRGCAETAPPAPAVLIREEPVSRRAWACGIHVRGPCPS